MKRDVGRGGGGEGGKERKMNGKLYFTVFATSFLHIVWRRSRLWKAGDGHLITLFFNKRNSSSGVL